jgi:hypothetical protein
MEPTCSFPQSNDVVSALLELHLSTRVHLGGGTFKGVLSGFTDRHGTYVEPLCLFDGRRGSTYALPVSRVSADAVRQHIAKQDALFDVAFEKFAEQACTNVFRQFSKVSA